MTEKLNKTTNIKNGQTIKIIQIKNKTIEN